jgi:polyhydroxyalkanoate synthase subunit PhaC
VVNPPHRDKYGYWTGSELTPDADAWLAGAKQHAGSWWPDWARWVRRHAGGRVPARAPGTGDLPAIEDAPGSYVRRRIV